MEFFWPLQVQEFEGKETAMLIDRYKYLDLYPCSQSELRSLGYWVSPLFNSLVLMHKMWKLFDINLQLDKNAHQEHLMAFEFKKLHFYQ